MIIPSVWSDVKQWWLCWNVLVPWVMSWKDNGSTIYCLVQYWAGRYQLTHTGITDISVLEMRWLVKFTRIPPFIPGKMWDLNKHVNQLLSTSVHQSVSQPDLAGWDCKWAPSQWAVNNIDIGVAVRTGTILNKIEILFCSHLHFTSFYWWHVKAVILSSGGGCAQWKTSFNHNFISAQCIQTRFQHSN